MDKNKIMTMRNMEPGIRYIVQEVAKDNIVAFDTFFPGDKISIDTHGYINLHNTDESGFLAPGDWEDLAKDVFVEVDMSWFSKKKRELEKALQYISSALHQEPIKEA